MFTVYLAKENADLTEGRGPMKTVGIFTDVEEAVKAIKGRGVMGVGDGEVYSVTVYDSVEDWRIDPSSRRYEEHLVYGFVYDAESKRRRYGYVDGRDLPRNDPEYKEYVRLKQKFES